jgi:predicted benzoate:H+ symporter BenE
MGGDDRRCGLAVLLVTAYLNCRNVKERWSFGTLLAVGVIVSGSVSEIQMEDTI